MKVNLPLEQTGHKFRNVRSEVTVDGKYAIIVIGLDDRDTAEPKGEIRFHATYQTLNGLLAKLAETAGIAKTMLEKTGQLDAVTAVGGGVRTFRIESSGAGVIEDEQLVGLEIRTTEGPTFDFEMSPGHAQALSQSLVVAAKQATNKLQRH